MKRLLSLLLASIFVLSSFVLTACEMPKKTNESGITRYIPVKAEVTYPKGISAVTLDFGENNLLLRKTKLQFGKIIQTVEFIYDSNNKSTKVQKNSDGEVLSITENTYDSNGMLIETVFKDGNGLTQIITQREYDSKGQLKVMDSRALGSQSSKNIYSYDDNGNLTRVIQTAHDGSINTETYTYDSNGKLIERTMGDQIFTYTYDSDGKLIKVTGPGLFVSSNLEENSTYDLTYDTNGNITKIIVTNDINEKYIFTFEYKEVTIPQEMIETDINISIESLYLDLAGIIALQYIYIE